MKKFEFSLSRMLSYKEQMLENEKSKLAVLNIKRREIEEHIERQRAELKRISDEFLTVSKTGISSMELKNYNFQIENNKLFIKQLLVELETAAAEADEQLQVVMLATQEVEGLEKLKEKQYEEYQYADLKAQELVISEFVSSKYLRDQSEE